MGGGGSQSTTTVQKADPWKAAQPYLKEAMQAGSDLYGRGDLAADPFGGRRNAAPSNPTQMAESMMMQQAGQGMGATEAAQGYLQDAMSGNWQSGQLARARRNALSNAVPAAMSQFSGSGMGNSSVAMDTVGRAAAEAVAPYEYDAMNQMQTQGMRAAAMAPTLDQAQYLPAQMMGQVGASRDARNQNQINANIARHYEGQNQEAANLGSFADMMLGYGGMGRSSSSMGTQPGASGAQKVLGGGLTGLGTYGMLATNPVTAPFAMAGGIGAGLMGLF